MFPILPLWPCDPNRRKIPNNYVLSSSGTYSTSTGHHSSSSDKTNNAHNNLSAPHSSLNFPSFPSVPKGFIRAPRSCTTNVHPRPPLARASPACRAFLYAKTVWAERKRALASRLCIEPDGGEGWLASEEENAVEFSGVVWGKGLDDSEGLGLHRMRRTQKGAERLGGGMGRGVREILTKDGLSITAIVREELSWYSAGRKKVLVPDLSEKAFDFRVDSPGE